MCKLGNQLRILKVKSWCQIVIGVPSSKYYPFMFGPTHGTAEQVLVFEWRNGWG